MKQYEMKFVKTKYLIKENTTQLQTNDCTVIIVVKQQLGYTLCNKTNTQEFKEKNVPRLEEGRERSITGPKVGATKHFVDCPELDCNTFLFCFQ